MRTYIPKATCNMSRYANSHFACEVSRIQEKLSQSEYNMVVPSPAEILPLLERFKIYVRQSEEHNYSGALQRKFLRDEIYNLVRKQCASVNGLAQDNIDFLTNCGFELNKPATHHPAPEQCTNLRIEPRQQRHAKISFDGIKHRDCYEVRITDSHGYSQSCITTKPHAIMGNLPANKLLTVVVRGINGKGEGEWSTPTTFVLANGVDDFEPGHNLTSNPLSESVPITELKETSEG